jgi:hypothetical protein
MVFDGPSIKGAFSKRIKELEAEIGSSNSVVKVVDQTLCNSKEHLE